MILLYIIAVVIAIVIQYFIAVQFESVAADKGYRDSKYFHFCFWLGIVGYLLVIALPDRNNSIAVHTNVPGNDGFAVATNNNPVVPAFSRAEEKQDEPFTWQPASVSGATVVSETNIQCDNCRRVQFRGNKFCNRCGAKFVSFR